MDIIAVAIAPQQQKVHRQSEPDGALQPAGTACLHSRGLGVSCAQAAYAEYLGKDDSGAIAAFLDDPRTSLLQVSLAKSSNGQLQVRLTNSADFPKGCFYQVCACRQQHRPRSSVLLHTLHCSPPAGPRTTPE